MKETERMTYFGASRILLGRGSLDPLKGRNYSYSREGAKIQSSFYSETWPGLEPERKRIKTDSRLTWVQLACS